MLEADVFRWRVEIHLDGLLTMEQELAIVGYEGFSVTTDSGAGLSVVTCVDSAHLPTVPLLGTVAVLQHHAPRVQINAVQITRTLSEKEAAEWVKKQFSTLKVSWKPEP